MGVISSEAEAARRLDIDEWAEPSASWEKVIVGFLWSVGALLLCSVVVDAGGPALEDDGSEGSTARSLDKTEDMVDIQQRTSTKERW